MRRGEEREGGPRMERGRREGGGKERCIERGMERGSDGGREEGKEMGKEGEEDGGSL